MLRHTDRRHQQAGAQSPARQNVAGQAGYVPDHARRRRYPALPAFPAPPAAVTVCLWRRSVGPGELDDRAELLPERRFGLGFARWADWSLRKQIAMSLAG